VGGLCKAPFAGPQRSEGGQLRVAGGVRRMYCERKRAFADEGAKMINENRKKRRDGWEVFTSFVRKAPGGVGAKKKKSAGDISQGTSMADFAGGSHFKKTLGDGGFTIQKERKRGRSLIPNSIQGWGS